MIGKQYDIDRLDEAEKKILQTIVDSEVSLGELKWIFNELIQYIEANNIITCQ